jgi:fructose-1,6-bisphosphatase/inositol monophosphatase family enzyme
MLVIEAHGIERLPTIRRSGNLFERVRTMRVYGSFALDLAGFAAGRVQIGIGIGAAIWDMAGGIMIVEETGGWVGDLDGKSLVMDVDDPDKKYNVLFCRREQLDKIRALLGS